MSPSRPHERPVITTLLPTRRPPLEEGPEVQGALALDLRTPSRTLDAPNLDPALPQVELAPAWGHARVDHVGDPEVRQWAAGYAQALVECLAGHRPVSQLLRRTAPEVFRDLERRCHLLHQVNNATRRRRPQVRSVHLCRPGPDVVEASVHLRYAERSRAVAMRLERVATGPRRGQWCCTVLEFV